MRGRTATYEELQFSTQIPSRLEFLRDISLFAEGFARALPLVFGPLIIRQWIDGGVWAEAAAGWGAVCRFTNNRAYLPSSALMHSYLAVRTASA
jgi:hypothetical protein